MSTKIYNAFRLKPGVDLWSFLWEIKAKAQKRVTKILGATYDRLLSTEMCRDEIRKALKRDVGDPFTPLVVSDFIRQQYRETLTQPNKSYFNLDVWMTVRELRGRFYLIYNADLLGPLSKVWDFLYRDRRLEEYHYQNSTDRPKHINERRWAHRRKCWDEILGNVPNGKYLKLDVVDYQNFYDVDPAWQMKGRWKKEMLRHFEAEDQKRKAAEAAEQKGGPEQSDAKGK